LVQVCLHRFGAKPLAIAPFVPYKPLMHEFRAYLQQEFVRRTTKNQSYSLRAFAQHLGTNHATLSSILSGKRQITRATIQRMAKALDLGPAEVERFESACKKSKGPRGEGEGPLAKEPVTPSYFVIQQDAFAAMSDWYFDAILELALIPRFNLQPEVIAPSIGISELQARIGLETLERLELLTKDEAGRYRLQNQNSTNLLSPEFTSAANRKYQRSVLEKSIEALERVDRKDRDHTSTTMAIEIKDLAVAKELIQKFRHELNAFLQRDGAEPDGVYQLQVAFFPLTQYSNSNNQE
jgi:uncharacterized protein (TIGR02147 family)